MMNLRDVYEYYSREDVQNFMLSFGKDREVVGAFRNGNFSQRPNVILYPNDITAMVRTGVVEFHSSLERWSQPMSLRQDNYNSLRKGWDLIFDIDCKLFEHGKIAAEAFVWGLRKHGIKNVYVKYTGGRGFHIGVPWESMPKTVDYKPSESLYPDIARKIVFYLKEFVRQRLERNLFKKFSAEDISHQINKPLGKILTDDGINVYEVLDVDPVLISPRHLFRMPYSLNGKTFLVSLPIKPDSIQGFERTLATADKVKVETGFLGSGERDEAELLVAEAVDWNVRLKKKARERMENRIEITAPVPPEKFPPCIKSILEGLSDGRKRSVFILLNFLRSSKWNWNEIEKYMVSWNEKNKPPMREGYIRSQIRWHRAREAKLPPNCANEGYYKGFGVCKPDERCRAIKNPVNYAIRKEAEKTDKRKARRKSHSA